MFVIIKTHGMWLHSAPSEPAGQLNSFWGGFCSRRLQLDDVSASLRFKRVRQMYVSTSSLASPRECSDSGFSFHSHTTRHTALANQPPQTQFLALHLLGSNAQASFPPSGLLLGVFQGTSCILTLLVAAPEKRMLLAVTTKAI